MDNNVEWMWADDRHCADEPTGTFFPERGDTLAVDLAKTICQGCPYLEPCRQYAIADPSLSGIWGGLSGKERRLTRSSARRSGAPITYRPRRNPPPCGTTAGYIAHRRRDEEACEACRAAHARYHRERNRARAS
jgi:hypothetical protein